MSPGRSPRRRGQPLLALTLLLGGWVAARALVPTDGWLDVPLPPNVTKRVGETVPPLASHRPMPIRHAPDPPHLTHGGSAPHLPASGVLPHRPVSAGALRVPEPMAGSAQPPAPVVAAAPQMPAPTSRAPAASVPFAAAPPGTGRWSFDSWVLWREDGQAAMVSTPSYGASQAGAVLRYRLAPESAMEPRVHLRATTALRGEQAEIAAGVGVRPVASIPVEVLAEGRVARFTGDTRARPAVMAVLGPPPRALPGGLTGEAYAQAGYVGGKGATAFADGQVRVTRGLEIGDIKLQAGAGMWGGAQEGAARLDAGPTVSAIAPVGKGIFMRFSLDWREKVAGDAEPGSGPVVTLSAGF